MRLRTLFGIVGLLATAVIALPFVLAADKPAEGQPAIAARTGPSSDARRLKVLFLGDNGHHVPMERARQIAIPLALRGVDIQYTDDLKRITPEGLKGYDVLMVYANITKATPDVEKTILDYVANGGGYAPIHCASYCWLNSVPLTELTGGRFKRHGTGVFKETIVKPEHSVLKGLHPIESWDESYVHEMHNDKDREVLSYREDKEGKEPYTWTRTHGKGRVFYTAWGHDERTWGNVDFQNLLERGLRWSAGDWALQPQEQLKPFEYGEGKAPNYLAVKEWGKAGALITKIQKPVEVAESVKHMVLPPGFEPKLFASDPQIFKPICMAWDERGRLWIAETTDYPNELQNEGEGRDRISILEDTNGDGVADKFTVFAEKLSIPTSMCFANGGVVVAQAPHMLFLKDTDGDGKADVRKVLFTGWGTGDTHAGPSSLRWGFDNWIYGIVGYSGFRGEVGGKTMSFSQGIFRMKPDGSAMEFLGNLTNNAWGLGFSEDGNVFASTANNHPSFYLHIPNRAYESVRGLAVRRLEPIMDTSKFYPATDKVRQVDVHGGYTAAAGHALYTARTWPSSFWNTVAFVNEPTGHLIGQFKLIPKGSGFVARNDLSFFSSTDEWTSPIMSEVGPDGQVWMVDWYNFIIQHNPIPQGFEKGKGNAYQTPLRDKTHGRIYRLVYKDGKPTPPTNLGGATTGTLVATLKNENMLWRMHAQRLLVESKDKSLAGDLIKLTEESSLDAIGNTPGALHALWTLQGVGLLDGSSPEALAAVTKALKHPSAAVRKAAADVIPRNDAGLAAILSAKLVEDKDAQVRKSALLAIAEMPATDAAGSAVYGILDRPENADDRWIADAATIAGARQDAGFLKAALTAFKAPETTGVAPTPQPVAKNLIPNPTFSASTRGAPRAWKPRNYTGEGKQTYSETVGRTETHSLVLSSEKGADTSWFVDVTVDPNSEYTLSGWIKTDNVKPVRGGMGALFNIHGTEYRSAPVIGTADWTKVEIRFKTGSTNKVSINCLFGGWGHATGTAYYDDLELIKTKGGPSAIALPGTTGQVVGAVISQYASRGPKDSIVGTLSALKSSQPQLATLFVDNLAANWPDGKAAAPELSAADATELQAVLKSLPPIAKDRLVALVSKWGRTDVLGEAVAAAAKELRATADDVKASAAARGDAAKRLVAMTDSDETVGLLLKHINPQTPPDVQVALLTALGESRSALVGDKLVAGWKALTPTAAKTALPILLRREAWTRTLLAGIKKGQVDAKDLLPQQWQALTAHPDGKIASDAKAIQRSSGQAVNADRKALVEKLTPLVEKTGDVEKGKLVYEKNCMVCHTMDGKGGKVGPELTGVGARPKTDMFIDVIDPNRSVEGTYRQWIAKTNDDEVISGRLLVESQTSVEIIDAGGVVHPIQRSALKSLTASNLSVMPEGFEALPPEDLTNLMEYLSASKVKH